MPLEQRFLRHVDKGSAAPCWLWTGQTGGSRNRYGYFRKGTRANDPKTTAHRVAYELWVGPIPEGYEIDHVKARGCTSRLCVNPAHLEAVTSAENKRRERRILCRAGLHDLSDPAHAKFDSRGRRRGCRTCQNARARVTMKNLYHSRKAG